LRFTVSHASELKEIIDIYGEGGSMNDWQCANDESFPGTPRRRKMASKDSRKGELVCQRSARGGMLNSQEYILSREHFSCEDRMNEMGTMLF